jgi:release factor glutamine methyltransferase
LPEKYNIIVSNPPYVTDKEKEFMHPNVLQHEPHTALFVPDDDPLVFYKKIITLAKEALQPKGKLYFEINENYGWEVIKLCEQASCTFVKLVQDINGKDRIVKAILT